MSDYADNVKARLLEYIRDGGDGVLLSRKTDVPYEWIVRSVDADMPLPERVAERLAQALYVDDMDAMPSEYQALRKHGVSTAANRRSLEYYLEARRERLRLKEQRELNAPL